MASKRAADKYTVSLSDLGKQSTHTVVFLLWWCFRLLAKVEAFRAANVQNTVAVQRLMRSPRGEVTKAVRTTGDHCVYCVT